jgi:hypothetical protein
MSKISISIKISAIRKDLFYVSAKGEKYLNLEIYENDVPDKFGNQFAAKQGVPKDLKHLIQPGEKIAYCGNGKRWGDRPQRNGQTESQSANLERKDGQEIDENVPF